MGTGYTRNDTANNIADGNVINAADFDGEYDAIEAAFNSSTGHTHDGTAAEGGPITVLGPSQEFVASASAVAPSTNAGLDLGTTSLKFNDLYIDGTAYIDGLGGNLLIDTSNALQFRDTALSISSSADGQLDIAADTTAKITSPEVIVTDDFRLQSDAAILTFGADDDVSVTHVADTGLDAKAASGFVLKLQTGDTTVESGNTLGKISFNAPDEAGGTDAILVGAEIEAAAEATFSSTDNSTALVFKTNTSAAATERMRIKSDGDIVTQGANYTMTWDHSADALTFVDNAKIILGTGSDLEIYHDSLNSVIKDAGTGNLVIAADDFRLQNSSQTANMISANDDGAVTLTYNGGNRLATTTDGIDVTGDISVGNLNVDTNTISSTDTNGDINLSPNGTGTVVINTDLDVDNININGNSITSTDTNGDINITPNGTGKVNIAGGFVPSEINLTSTDAGATAGPVFELHRNSASPADNDAIGAIDFAGQDDGGNKVIYASIDATIMDVTDTTEDGRLDFITQTAGSNYSRMRFDPTETVFNEAGADINFRIEGDTDTNLFVVDASADAIGIGTNSPLRTFVISNAGGNGIELDPNISGESEIISYNRSTSSYTPLKFAGSSVELQPAASGAVIINQGSNDADFRVESDTNTHALYVDGGASGGASVGIGNSAPAAWDTTFNGVLQIGNDGFGFLANYNKSAGNYQTILGTGFRYNGGYVSLHTDSGYTYLNATNGSLSIYGGDATASVGDAITFWDRFKVGVTTPETVVNESAGSFDFRVESDNKTHMLFVDSSKDAVQIGSNMSQTQGALDVGFSVDSDTTNVMTIRRGLGGNNTSLATGFGFPYLTIGGSEYVAGGNYRGIGFGYWIPNNGYASSRPPAEIAYFDESVASGTKGSLVFGTRDTTAGGDVPIERMRIYADGRVTINETGISSSDFRIESDSVSEAFVVDAGANNVRANNFKWLNTVSAYLISGGTQDRNIQIHNLGGEYYLKVYIVGLRTYTGSAYFTRIVEVTGHGSDQYATVISNNQYGGGLSTTVTVTQPSSGTLNLFVDTGSTNYRFAAMTELIYGGNDAYVTIDGTNA